MSCAQGYASDGFMRWSMPLGIFSVPPGQDCYLELISFSVLAWFLAILSTVTFVLLSIHLREKRVFMMKLLLHVVWVNSAVDAAFMFVCLFAPTKAKFMYAAMMLGVGIACSLFLYIVGSAKLRMLKGMANISTTQLLGGAKSIASLVLFGIGFTGLAVSAFVAAALYDPLNEAPSFGAYQAICYFTFLVTLSFILCVWFILGAFIETIKNVSKNSTSHKKIPTSMPANLSDVVNRFQNVRKFFLFVIPNLALYVANAHVLPLFFYLMWFIAFVIHMVNILFWMTILTKAEKMQVLGPCGMVITDRIFSSSPPRLSPKLESKPGNERRGEVSPIVNRPESI